MRVYACVHMHRICLKAAAGMVQACDDAPAIPVAWSDAWSQFLPDPRSIQKPLISLHCRTSCIPPHTPVDGGDSPCVSASPPASAFPAPPKASAPCCPPAPSRSGGGSAAVHEDLRPSAHHPPTHACMRARHSGRQSQTRPYRGATPTLRDDTHACARESMREHTRRHTQRTAAELAMNRVAADTFAVCWRFAIGSIQSFERLGSLLQIHAVGQLVRMQVLAS